MKTLKTILFLTFSLICLNSANNKLNSYFVQKHNTSVLTSEVEKVSTYTIRLTMYYATSSQCDNSPLITADGSKINPLKATEQKMVALSRNLLKKWGGDLDYGDLIEISGTGEKDGIYRVSDTMNKRIIDTVDILETNGTPLYKFENIKIRKVLS